MSTGWTGPQGSQGVNGVTGPTGINGQQGFQGSAGFNGMPYGVVHLPISTNTTLPSGYINNITVVSVNTGSNITLTLPAGIPNGSWVFILWCINSSAYLSFNNGSLSTSSSNGSYIGFYSGVFSAADGCWNAKISVVNLNRQRLS
jgi:hypothetical protein